MAQQKMFQPVLSEVGTPTYVAPGVQDTSMATLISGLGGQAVSAYKDWEVSRAGNQTIEAIEAYKKGDVDYFRPGTTADIEKAKNVALKAGQEMEARKFALEGQWDIAGAIPSDTSKTGMVGWKDIYEAESGLASQMSTFDEKLQNLKAAQAQGKVTPADFYARSLTIAREAINRTPGLQQEIARKMDSILKYSGMEDRLTLEQKALKAQQDAAVDNMKRLQAYADKEHIPYSFDTAPLELEMMVNKHKEKQYLLQAAQDVNTFSTAQGQARARAFIESGSSWKVRSAVQDNFVNNIYGSIKDLPPEKAAGVVANAIVTHREQAIRDYEQTLIRTGLPSTDPLFVKELEGLRSRLDAAAEAWKGLATGATAADIYTNIQRVNNVIDEQALAEQYGMTPTEMKYITPLVGNLAAAVVSKGDPGLLKEVQGMTLNFVKNITNGYANKQAGKPDVLGPATRSIFQLSKDYPADSTVKQYTENFFATLNTTIASTDAELTPRVKQNMMYTALKTAADPNNKEVNATLSATAVTEFNKMFGSFSTGHVQLMNDAKIEGALDVLPDGRLTITGGNAEQIRTLIEPINLAIEAYANVNGLDKQKATYIVLSQMFQQDPNLNSVLDDPDLKGSKPVSGQNQSQAGQSGSTNPGNLKDLQGNVRTFASQEEGIRANAEQLKLYFTRGSQIDKRPLTTVKDIINSWRPEKDIRKGDISQQGYIDFVAKSLGVAPDQQLQPTNHTLAKLIAAMSIREGNPVPYEVVIDALIGTSETAVAAERPAAVAPAAPKPATPTGRPARGATKPNATQNTFDFDNIWEGIKDIATFGKAGTSFGGINFTGPADIYPAEKKQTPEQRARNIAALAAADMRSKKVDPDAIQSVTSFLDPVLDAAESVHPSVGYATAALLMFLGSPKAAEALTKKITSKGIKFATPPAGREVVAGSNVMPLNEGASKAVIAAMQGAKKKEAEALFKDYWTTKWQKDRISLPKTDLEWRNAIVEANQYVADRLAKKPLKSMDKK